MKGCCLLSGALFLHTALSDISLLTWRGRCETFSTCPRKIQGSNGQSICSKAQISTHSNLSQALQPILDRGDETATPTPFLLAFSIFRR